MNKYGAKKVSLDGYSFSSKLEASVFSMLKATGVEIIQVQDHVYLTDARILYIPDFKCRDIKTGEIYHVEAKGFEAARWPTIKKLWKFYGPGRLEIWKGSYQRPFLDETIIPKAG